MLKLLNRLSMDGLPINNGDVSMSRAATRRPQLAALSASGLERFPKTIALHIRLKQAFMDTAQHLLH